MVMEGVCHLEMLLHMVLLILEPKDVVKHQLKAAHLETAIMITQKAVQLLCDHMRR